MNWKEKVLFTFLLHSGIVFFSFSQSTKFSFNQFTTQDGIPSSEVHYALRDSKGFMWFATDHGAVRFNGYRFEEYASADNSVLSLYEDFKKRIWIITFSGRLFYVENNQVFPYRFNDLILRGGGPFAIRSFYVDRAEKIFISTSGLRSYSIDSTGRIQNLMSIAPKVSFRYVSREYGSFSYFDSIYVQDFTYYYYFPGNMCPTEDIILEDGGKIKKYTVDFLGNHRKGDVKKLSDGRMLFFRGERLYQLTEKDAVLVGEFAAPILDVLEGTDGQIWVGTYGKGLHILGPDFAKIDAYFPSASITSMAIDGDGGYWITTLRRGIFYLPSRQVRQLQYRGAPLNAQVRFVRSGLGDSALWAGTSQVDLYRFKRNQPDKCLRLRSDDLYDLSYDSVFFRSYLLSGYETRMVGDRAHEYYWVQREKVEGMNFTSLRSIAGYYIKDGSFYGGNSTGLFRVSRADLFYLDHPPRTRLMEKRDFALNYLESGIGRIDKIYKTTKGELLAGNIYGLWKIEKEKLVPYDTSEALLTSRITDITEYGPGTLCLATRGTGLLFLVNDSIHQLTSKDGLTSNNIRKIYVDGDRIWLATNRGISVLFIHSLSPLDYTVRHITSANGMPSNEVNGFARYGNEIYIATNAGVSVIAADYFEKLNKQSVPLYIERVIINGEDVEPDREIRLNYRNRNITVSVVALDFQNTRGLKYRYRLQGFDDDWIDAAGLEIQLSNLPYGNYNLEIQAKREFDDWTEASTRELKIAIRAPFWEKKIFWLALVTALLTGVIYYAYRTVGKIKRRQEEKNRLNKKLADLETQAVRAQMNPHFIFNALNSIQYYITHNKREEAMFHLVRFSKLVRSILDSSRKIFITLDEEIDMLNLYLEFEKIRFEDKFDYSIYVEPGLRLSDIFIPNMMIQPFVENSIKHAFHDLQEKGRIWLKFEKNNGSVLCTITDNGIGREKAALLQNETGEKKAGSLGNLMIQEKVDAFLKYYHYRMDIRIGDADEANQETPGTRVRILFPADAKPV